MNTNVAPIKVVVSDLDGTLLNQNHDLTSYTLEVFEALHQEGFLIIIATGRHHIDAKSVLHNFTVPHYLVSSNGARIHSPSNHLLYAKNIDHQVLASVFKLDLDPKVTAVLFKEKVWLTSKPNEMIVSYQKDASYPPQVVDFKSLEDYTALKLFFTHDNHEDLVKVKQQILSIHDKELSHAFSLPLCLEFMHKEVDKKNAIAKVLELENFTFKNTIAFGDGFNDEHMLLAAGTGLIMGNAPENLQQKLNHLKVIATNRENGVANYLKERLLNKL